MKIKKINLWILGIVLLFLQLIINNVSKIYIDLFGSLMLAMIIYGEDSIKKIFLLSLIADLIGYWYLGSHSVVTLIISFITIHALDYYRMSSFIQKILIIIFFGVLYFGLLFLISLFFNKIILAWWDYLIQIVIITPTVAIIFEKFIINNLSSINIE